MTDRARLLSHLTALREIAAACRALVRTAPADADPARVSAALRACEAVVAGAEQLARAIGDGAL